MSAYHKAVEQDQVRCRELCVKKPEDGVEKGCLERSGADADMKGVPGGVVGPRDLGIGGQVTRGLGGLGRAGIAR